MLLLLYVIARVIDQDLVVYVKFVDNLLTMVEHYIVTVLKSGNIEFIRYIRINSLLIIRIICEGFN